MTICNMSIEWGARAGMIAPDETTFAYLEGRPHAPTGAEWERAVEDWRSLASDPDAAYDTHVVVDVAELVPAGDLGHEPRHGRARHGHRARPGDVPRRRRPGRGRARARVHGAAAGPADRGDPDRPRLHRLLHELPDRGSARGGGDRRAASTVDAARDGARRARLGARCAVRPRKKVSTRSSSTPASSGASPAARCASG